MLQILIFFCGLQLDFKLFDYDPEHIFKVLKIEN